MDIGAVFLILTVALLAGLFISRPFLAARPARSPALPRRLSQDENQRSRLLAEYDRYLTALQELDFDQTLGKIPEGDYPQQRQAFLQAAADILRRLDADFGAPAQKKMTDTQIETQNLASQSRNTAATVETQNLAPLRDAGAAADTPEDRIEAAIAARRTAVQPQNARVETQNLASQSRITPATVETQNLASQSRNTPANVETQNLASLHTQQPTDNLEAMIAARRRTRQEKSNGFCPSCGKPVQKSDRFCPKCGKAL